MGLLGGAESQRRDQTPANYRQAAKADAESACVGTDRLVLFECVYEKVEAGREQAHDEQDLSAQQRAASAALIAALAGLAGLGVSGVGIYYIRRTIRQGQEGLKLGRETKDETIRIGEAQTRAYLSVVRADFHVDRKKRTPGGMPSVETILHVANSGETPAVNVSYFCTGVICKWGDKHVLPDDLDCVPHHGFTTNIPPREPEPIDAVSFGIARVWRDYVRAWATVDEETKFGEMPGMMIYGVMFYEDVFGQTFRSKFGFLFTDRPRAGGIGRDKLPTLQTRIPTFERIEDRMNYIQPDDE